uniref:C2H2-type domain-containing protein n=1 Tax=Kalanchoe fedtschenkoi TaxID=63787 RepID=A0A7N1A1D5_KALFE
MMSQGLSPVPSSFLGFIEDQIQNPDSSNTPATQPSASSSALKRKRNLPDPDSEVVALSPTSLMATNRFLCEICNKGFQRDQNLQLHRRGHNLPWKLKQRSNKEVVKKKVYICPEKSCVHHDPSRALGDLTGIKKHFSRKHGEKKWKCDKCPKKYAVKSDWKAHSKICGTKEHKCDCGTLFSRKDSFITHRAFCTAVVDQSGSRFASSVAAGTNNPLSLRNDFLSENLGIPQGVDTNQFSGGGFYPELSTSFHSYGHVSNSTDGSKSVRHIIPQWLDQHPALNASAHLLMGNLAGNLSHELLLQNAGQVNLFGSSSSSQAPWLNKCTDQSAFGGANMSSLDQILGNTSGGSSGMMQVKREDEILSNADFVENMTTSLYNPNNLSHQQQQAITSNQSAADQFLSSFYGRSNSNSLGLISSGASNGQVSFAGNNNNGFVDNSSFCIISRPPPPVIKDSDNTNASLNHHHQMLLHEAVAAGRAKPPETNPNAIKQQQAESSQTRDFLGVGRNEIMREEQFQLAMVSDQQFGSAAAGAESDMSHYNQQWKH